MIYKLKNIPKSENSLAGFTLIEMIVVFAIIAVLSTLGVASFVSYGRSQALNSSVSDLVTILNLAKSRAQSQVKPSCAGSLDGYEIRLCGVSGSPTTCINSINANYELDARCNGSVVSPPISTGKLSQNVSFGSYPSPTTTTSIFFSVLTGGVAGFGTIAMTGYSQTKSIVVDQSGNISQ